MTLERCLVTLCVVDLEADPLSDPSASVAGVGSVLGPPGSDPAVTPIHSVQLWL